VATQALIEDDLEKIGDQLKEKVATVRETFKRFMTMWN
jgi:hypothetical protein